MHIYYTEEHSFKVFVAWKPEFSTPLDLWKFVLDLFIYIHVWLSVLATKLFDYQLIQDNYVSWENTMMLLI